MSKKPCYDLMDALCNDYHKNKSTKHSHPFLDWLKKIKEPQVEKLIEEGKSDNAKQLKKNIDNL